jgi:phosphopantetheinyl transferase
MVEITMPQSSPVEVHIWYQNTEAVDEEALDFADTLLCQEERAQRDRFRLHENGRDYAMAHSLLRRSLSMYAPYRLAADWQFGKNAFGKPHIAGVAGLAPTPEFNLSHTAGFVACAISSARVGIDVERVREVIDYEALTESHFSREEFRMLKELPQDARATRAIELWTLKESFLKGVGCGLSGPLDSIWFEVGLSDDIGFHAPAGIDTGAWNFVLFAPEPEVRMAVAVESSRPPMIFLQGRACWLPECAIFAGRSDF